MPCLNVEVVSVNAETNVVPQNAPAKIEEMDCVVHFRPCQDWKGEYGFDWMRVGDWGDVAFNRIVAKQYRSKLPKRSENLEKNVNAYSGNYVFDEFKYKELKREYNCFSAFSNKRSKNTRFEYFCPWLSMYPGDTVQLSAIYDVIDTGKPDYLEFAENDNFQVKSSSSSNNNDSNNKNKRFKCPDVKTVHNDFTIKCLKAFDKDQKIELYAYKGKKKQLAGRLYVWANAQPRKIKVVMVEVKTPPISSKDYLKGMADRTFNANKYLRQSLVQIASSNVEFLDLSDDEEFKLNLLFPNGVYTKNKKINSRAEGNNIKPFYDYVYERLQKKLKKENKDENKYADYLKLFFWGEQETIGRLGVSIDKARQIHFFNTTTAVSPEVLAHEILHALGLSHTFTNEIAKSTAKYTYWVAQTCNLMDYNQETKKLHYLYHWQWEVAHNGAKKFQIL
ncbi:hypothetical protein D0T60_07440 [Bacteroides sp. 224]|nr:hypothetical protein [Bacteroides sp. 224]